MNSQVAAGNGSASNGNALAFGNLRGATGTEAGWTQLVASQSQQVTAANALDSAATARFTGTSQARDNISAVDLDKEAGDLIRYQQAYDAAARDVEDDRVVDGFITLWSLARDGGLGEQLVGDRVPVGT